MLRVPLAVDSGASSSDTALLDVLRRRSAGARRGSNARWTDVLVDPSVVVHASHVDVVESLGGSERSERLDDFGSDRLTNFDVSTSEIAVVEAHVDLVASSTLLD